MAFAWRTSLQINDDKGLVNNPGEHNCFLNAAVQILWHLRVFRRSMQRLHGHSCMQETCIFCAVKVLFTRFAEVEDNVIAPDILRLAMADVFQDEQRFQLGVMDDAAECFENILARLHWHLCAEESCDFCHASHCITHRMFGMNILEQICCQTCGEKSEPNCFMQLVHYISVPAIVNLVQVGMKDRLPFGTLMRFAGGVGDERQCANGECNALVQIERTLLSFPAIVSIGLVWESDSSSIDTIMALIGAIEQKLLLKNLFSRVTDHAAKLQEYKLVGMVIYYGMHYSTLFYSSSTSCWVFYDDRTVRKIGSWKDVMSLCRRGHYQPLLLIYSNENASPIEMDVIPTTVVPMTRQQKENMLESVYSSLKRQFSSPLPGTPARSVSSSSAVRCSPVEESPSLRPLGISAVTTQTAAHDPLASASQPQFAQEQPQSTVNTTAGLANSPPLIDHRELSNAHTAAFHHIAVTPQPGISPCPSAPELIESYGFLPDFAPVPAAANTGIPRPAVQAVASNGLSITGGESQEAAVLHHIAVAPQSHASPWPSTPELIDSYSFHPDFTPVPVAANTSISRPAVQAVASNGLSMTESEGQEEENSRASVEELCEEGDELIIASTCLESEGNLAGAVVLCEKATRRLKEALKRAHGHPDREPVQEQFDLVNRRMHSLQRRLESHPMTGGVYGAPALAMRHGSCRVSQPIHSPLVPPSASINSEVMSLLLSIGKTDFLQHLPVNGQVTT